MILFSLPVHEWPDVVQNQLDNIKRFVPESKTVVHVSASGANPHVHNFCDPNRIRVSCNIYGDIMNPEHLPTGLGLMHVHASNFLYAKSLGLKFDYVATIASNEMFIKGGLWNHVQKYDMGVQIANRHQHPNWHLFGPTPEMRDHRLNLLSKQLGVEIMGGQAEGNFFRTDIFAGMVDAFHAAFTEGVKFGLQTEELIPQTFAYKTMLTSPLNVTLPFTLQNYTNPFEINPELIDRIRLNNGTLNTPLWGRCLQSPHMNQPFDTVFSIKRIPRDFGYLRNHISGLYP